MTGQTLGHYRIESKLGEGGMGVVYKARDTHLDRFVAIKLLPPERVADPTRKARFVQEAKSASALNHPNIITIYDISSDAGHDFIAMEYVAGKTLDQLIPRRGMRLADVLKIAVQIAAALARAHAAGIVHRDLKPANIMVDEHGLVKVLDFGLAKLTEHTISGDESTATLGVATEEGTIVGTASYMSPEQAEGRKLDARSDIFSFGAVLYELLTGRRAFQGESKMAILSAILQKEPPPIKDVPPELKKLVARCLRKDPERRSQHMEDVKLALEELKEESDSGRMLDRGAAPASKRKWLWVLGAAAVVLLAAGSWLMSRRGAPLPQQTVSPVTTYAGSEMYPSFSPDGRQIAFSWDGEKGANPGIYVKLLGETNALRLTASADTYPAWAPDGKRIAFVRGEPNRGIYTVSALGGAERKLAGLAPTGQISWSPDGKWLALSLRDEKERGILLLPVEGGEPRRISNPKAPAFDRSPAFAPDGKRLAYVTCTGEYSCDVRVQLFGSGYFPRGGPRLIASQRVIIAGLTWSRDAGSLIYATDSPAFPGLLASYLWRVGADGRRAPQRLEVPGPMASSPSACPTANRLVFQRVLRDYDIWRYRTDEGIEPLIVSSLADYNPRFSPDGTKIAFESSRSGEAMEIWVAQADGSKPDQMTNLVGRYQGTPRWSPDNRWIAFDSLGQDGHWDIYVIGAAGGSPRRITSEPSDESVPSWSQDGKWIYFRSDRTGRFEIWRVPFARGQPEQVTTRGGNTASESIDGSTLFYTKVDSGPLFARRLSGGEEHEVLPYINLRSFLPAADGIYYIGRRSEAGYYPLEFLQFSRATSRLVAKIEGEVYHGLSVSPDRKTIIFTKTVSIGADLMMIENFQ